MRSGIHSPTTQSVVEAGPSGCDWLLGGYGSRRQLNNRRLETYEHCSPGCIVHVTNLFTREITRTLHALGTARRN